MAPPKPTLRRAAWLLATHRDASLRNGAEAVALAERAARLTGSQDAPNYWNLLYLDALEAVAPAKVTVIH